MPGSAFAVALGRDAGAEVVDQELVGTLAGGARGGGGASTELDLVPARCSIARDHVTSPRHVEVCRRAPPILVAILLNPSAVLYAPALWIVDDEQAGRRKRLGIAVAVTVTASAVGWISSRVF